MRQLKQSGNLHTLEPGRLLESIADTQTGTIGDRLIGDLLAIPENLTGSHLFKAHNQLGKGGLAAAVGAGDNSQPASRNGKGQIFDDLCGTVVLSDIKLYIFLFAHLIQSFQDSCNIVFPLSEENPFIV